MSYMKALALLEMEKNREWCAYCGEEIIDGKYHDHLAEIEAEQ